MEKGPGNTGPATMQIKITKDFAFAHRGVEIEHFTAGQVVPEASEELCAVALEQGWAEKAVSVAPENKDASRQREKKAK